MFPVTCMFSQNCKTSKSTLQFQTEARQHRRSYIVHSFWRRQVGYRLIAFEGGRSQHGIGTEDTVGRGKAICHRLD